MSETFTPRTLRSVLPCEFTAGEYHGTRAFKLRDEPVASVHREGWSWPGKQKHVCMWVKLANGLAVGWNENPSRGWSFPVVRA